MVEDGGSWQDRVGGSGDSAYGKWQKEEGIPIHRGAFADLTAVEVAPWPRVGQPGAFVNLAGQEEDDGWVIEIAPQGKTEVLHHCFEASYYVLDGQGGTLFWQQGGARETVEWKRGSVFSPPVNCYYQLFNADSSQPARLYAMTNAPMIINQFRNLRFVFDNPFVFDDRYDGSPGFFQREGEYMGNVWKTNFIPDIRTLPHPSGSERRDGDGRGLGASGRQFLLSNNQSVGHGSQFPAGTYKRAHRHGVGAHVIIVDGQGYSLLWFEGGERSRVDWKSGTVLSPREWEYHQHFNTGTTPTRYVAFRLGALDTRRPERGVGWNTQAEVMGIPYDREDPDIYDEYYAECQAKGVHVELPRPNYATA